MNLGKSPLSHSVTKGMQDLLPYKCKTKSSSGLQACTDPQSPPASGRALWHLNVGPHMPRDVTSWATRAARPAAVHPAALCLEAKCSWGRIATHRETRALRVLEDGTRPRQDVVPTRLSSGNGAAAGWAVWMLTPVHWGDAEAGFHKQTSLRSAVGWPGSECSALGAWARPFALKARMQCSTGSCFARVARG